MTDNNPACIVDRLHQLEDALRQIIGMAGSINVLGENEFELCARLGNILQIADWMVGQTMANREIDRLRAALARIVSMGYVGDSRLEMLAVAAAALGERDA